MPIINIRSTIRNNSSNSRSTGRRITVAAGMRTIAVTIRAAAAATTTGATVRAVAATTVRAAAAN